MGDGKDEVVVGRSAERVGVMPNMVSAQNETAQVKDVSVIFMRWPPARGFKFFG